LAHQLVAIAHPKCCGYSIRDRVPDPTKFPSRNEHGIGWTQYAKASAPAALDAEFCLLNSCRHRVLRIFWESDRGIDVSRYTPELQD